MLDKLITVEMQIKTTVKYPLTPDRMVIIKNICKPEMLERLW